MLNFFIPSLLFSLAIGIANFVLMYWTGGPYRIYIMNLKQNDDFALLYFFLTYTFYAAVSWQFYKKNNSTCFAFVIPALLVLAVLYWFFRFLCG